MRVLDAGILTLEPQSAAHAPAMVCVLADPAIYAHENAPPESVDALVERFTRLEARQSPNGQEAWLNWVVRLDTGELIGLVQSTVLSGGTAAIAYVLGSAWWGRGLASAAVRAMTDELVTRYAVTRLTAVIKQTNQRSLRLLQRMGFSRAPDSVHRAYGAEADEVLRQKMVCGVHTSGF